MIIPNLSKPSWLSFCYQQRTTGESFTNVNRLDETASRYIIRLDHCLSQWIKLAGIGKTYEELKELFLCEQFLHSCPRDLVVFIRERSPSTMKAIKELTDVYAESRSAVDIKETLKMNDMQDNSRPSHYSRSAGSHPLTLVGTLGLGNLISREPMRCFLSFQTSHKSVNCPTGKPLQLSPGKPWAQHM